MTTYRLGSMASERAVERCVAERAALTYPIHFRAGSVVRACLGPVGRRTAPRPYASRRARRANCLRVLSQFASPVGGLGRPAPLQERATAASPADGRGSSGQARGLYPQSGWEPRVGGLAGPVPTDCKRSVSLIHIGGRGGFCPQPGLPNPLQKSSLRSVRFAVVAFHRVHTLAGSTRKSLRQREYGFF